MFPLFLRSPQIYYLFPRSHSLYMFACPYFYNKGPALCIFLEMNTLSRIYQNIMTLTEEVKTDIL
jgi:hypothetical protein